ncbi:prepilin peptidase [Lachnospiraceae bacterium OttesenSCG-928-D06]|nr:prepilin peptidase [Lachnospiraceae bacterium OttesenSCG-928-D06]
MWKFCLTLFFLLVLTFFDIQSRKLPVKLLLLTTVLTLAASAYFTYNGVYDFKHNCFSLVPGIILLLAAFLTQKIGYGDGIVWILLGLTISYRESILIFMGSLILAAIVSALLLVFKKVAHNSKIPYIPFITVAYFFVCVGGWKV